MPNPIHLPAEVNRVALEAIDWGKQAQRLNGSFEYDRVKTEYEDALLKL